MDIQTMESSLDELIRTGNLRMIEIERMQNRLSSTAWGLTTMLLLNLVIHTIVKAPAIHLLIVGMTSTGVGWIHYQLREINHTVKKVRESNERIIRFKEQCGQGNQPHQ